MEKQQLQADLAPADDKTKILDPRFPRITVNPDIFGGKPCIRGMRFPVASLLASLFAGDTRETLLEDYPCLEPEDIDEACAFAVWKVGGEVEQTRFSLDGVAWDDEAVVEL